MSESLLSKVIHLPSGEMTGLYESRLALRVPVVSAEMSVVVWFTRSRRKTSRQAFVSVEPRLVARDSKTTNWPLDEIEAVPEAPFAKRPLLLMLTRLICSLTRFFTYRFRYWPLPSFGMRFLAWLKKSRCLPSA